MPERSNRWIRGSVRTEVYPDCTFLFVLNTIPVDVRVAIWANIYHKDTKYYV
jgi:hypothetical protein